MVVTRSPTSLRPTAQEVNFPASFQRLAARSFADRCLALDARKQRCALGSAATTVSPAAFWTEVTTSK